MLKQLQTKLKELHLIDENELILAQIQVSDYIKQQQQLKKHKEELANLLPTKLYNLVATIKRANNDSTPTIYLFKIIEKTNDLKLKLTWNLNEIKSITCVDDTFKNASGINNVQAFELVFKNASNSNNENQSRYVWKCESDQERASLINTLWKLSEEFLKASDRPKFVKFNLDPTLNDLSSKSNSKETTPQDSKLISLNNSNQYELTKSEEDSLLKLMAECDFTSSNAESFIQKLEKELLYLDNSNIESIMNSEENTLKLIEMLDQAVDEIDKIDKRLQVYEEKISAVGDAVRIVGERDNVIQLQQNNQHALLDLLENMMGMLEFSPEYQSILNECDLSSPKKIDRCVTAANQLLEIIETNLPLGLKQMRAYEEQINLLERIKLKFCNNAFNQLRNVINHSANKHMESYKIVENSLTALPPHKQIHEDLISFKELMPWIYKSSCYFNELDQKKLYYNDLKDNYIETVRQLYLREIIPFCTCARAKLIKLDKPKATASMENLKGSLSMRPKTDKNDQFIIRIDQATKDMLKTVFGKLLNHISVAVQNEQIFTQEFFSTRSPLNNTINNDSQSLSIQKFSRTNSTASMLSSSTNNSNKQSQNDNKNEMAILSQIFASTIEEQVKATIECILKLENMMVMFVYSDLLFRVLDCHNNKNFMHLPLTLLLRTAKEKCDEFVNHFKDLIRENKVNKREKIGIIRYVIYFEEFVKESESCWEPIKANMYEKLITIYQTIINEIWKGIESIASESQKTPPEVVRFQNYHQMHHIMRGISNLKESVKFAKEKYTQSKDLYVKELFGQPLEKLHNFFEKVDAQIQRGCKHEDVQYKLDLSVDKLREIIREYPAKEVKKGLESLYNKVEKQLVENSSLLEVVWQNMSSEFINQYKYYESLIKTCYPGKNQIALEFTEQDICEFFRDIAQMR